MASIYNVLSIVRGTTVDGPGFRTSIYLAGCTHGCPGCHNPQSWSFNAGTPMTLEEIMDIVREEDFNVTLTGGDPLCNPASTLALVEALKADHRNIWLYTGYTWEEIIATVPSAGASPTSPTSASPLPSVSASPTSLTSASPLHSASTSPTEMPSTEVFTTIPSLFEIIKKIDVVVEGPFIVSLRDPDLLFRGSSNQRLIDIPATISRSLSTPILYH